MEIQRNVPDSPLSTAHFGRYNSSKVKKPEYGCLQELNIVQFVEHYVRQWDKIVMGTFTFILERVKKTKTTLRRDGRCSGRHSNRSSLNKIGIISPYEHDGISISTMNASYIRPRVFIL
jgi:hypothetical protein